MLIGSRWEGHLSHFELPFGSLGILECLQLALKQLVLFAHCLKGVKLLQMHLCTVQIPGRVALRAGFMVVSIMLSSRQVLDTFKMQILSHRER